jgi:hypothetical protein
VQGRENRSGWFYELAARVSLIVGDAPIKFSTHSLTDSSEQDGQAWLFTDDVIVIAAVKGNNTRYDLTVEVVGRTKLVDLSVGHVSDPLTDHADWPKRLEITVSYSTGHSAQLPLSRYSRQLAELAALTPTLAKDLNQVGTPSR